jgi:multicomponent Na+:H+ antiporter subunit C
MELVFAILIGCLYALGIYLMLRRSIVKLILGIALLSYAANLTLFTSGTLVRGKTPIVAEGTSQLAGVYADPLAQALILTAIVISFGVTTFATVLIRSAYQALQTDDLDALNSTDLLDE